MKKHISVVFALFFSAAALAAPKTVKCEFNAREDRETRIVNGKLDGETFTVTDVDLLLLEGLNENPVQVPQLKSMTLSTMDSAGDSGARLEFFFERGLHRGKSLANMDYVEVDMSGDLPAVHYRGSCFVSDRN
jgi:hypothetical protein